MQFDKGNLQCGHVDWIGRMPWVAVDGGGGWRMMVGGRGRCVCDWVLLLVPAHPDIVNEREP